VACGAGSCTAKVVRCELEEHEKVCPYVMVTCPLAGCGERLLRKGLMAHLGSTRKAHVALLAAEFVAQQQQLAEYEAENDDEDEDDEDEDEE
jgi:hypothetical protein